MDAYEHSRRIGENVSGWITKLPHHTEVIIFYGWHFEEGKKMSAHNFARPWQRIEFDRSSARDPFIFDNRALSFSDGFILPPSFFKLCFMDGIYNLIAQKGIWRCRTWVKASSRIIPYSFVARGWLLDSIFSCNCHSPVHLLKMHRYGMDYFLYRRSLPSDIRKKKLRIDTAMMRCPVLTTTFHLFHF